MAMAVEAGVQKYSVRRAGSRDALYREAAVSY
jgi:hypothetical protein